MLPDLHQANTFQNFPMLRNRRLLHLHCIHNLGDGPLSHRQILQDVPPPQFRRSIEPVRVCRRSCHILNICPYRYMSSIRYRFSRHLFLICVPLKMDLSQVAGYSDVMVSCELAPLNPLQSAALPLTDFCLKRRACQRKNRTVRGSYQSARF
jgi:hypothetical protein